MYKICYIIGQLDIGGAEKQMFELIKNLDKKTFSPIVISLTQGGYWSQKIKDLEVPLFEIKRHGKMELKRLLKVYKILKTVNPDIIHGYDFASNTYGRIAALFAKIKILIVAERNIVDIGPFKKRHHLIIDKLLSYFTNAIICNSKFAADSLVNKYKFNNKKVTYIHNGIDSLGAKANVNHSSDYKKIVIGTVGRLVPQKDYKVFLQVARDLIYKFKNMELCFKIVGGGMLFNELEMYTKHLGISDKVQFLGERNDIPELLETFDIFLMTSEHEGLSNAIMEAMTKSLPIVTTDVGGNKELIIDGKNGFISPKKDVTSLVENVSVLLKETGKIKAFGEASLKRIKNEFSTQKMVCRTEKLYLELLNPINQNVD